MALLIFILILSVLVLIHELGHFTAAKINGVRVEEFGWGLPPRIYGKKFGETIYSINLLPFGGFVKLTGEDSPEENVKDPHNFAAKTPMQRIVILTAGVFMNVVLAVVVFYFFMFANGFKTFHMPLLFDYNFRFGHTERIGTVISGIQPGLPAEEAGIALGEAVTEINGIKVNSVPEFKKVLAEQPEHPVTLTLLDLKDTTYASTRKVEVAPVLSEEDGSPVVGVYLMDSVSISYNTFAERALSGFYHSYNMLGYSLSTLGNIFAISFETKDMSLVSDSVSGPVGIYHLVDMVLEYGGPNAWLTLLDYMALMSLSLAFINLMPFPALDGGRIVFVLFEGITKKKPNPKLEAAFHQAGMLVLISLLILVTIRDIAR